MNGNSLQNDRRYQGASRFIVALIVLLISTRLFTLGYRAFASTNTVNAFTTVTAGVLQTTSASTSNSFTGVNVLFTSQTATMPDLGAMRVSDARGSGAGWTMALSAVAWNEANNNGGGNVHTNQLDYNGTGSDGNLGKMCIITSAGQIRSQAGANTTGITKGSLACFSASVNSLSIYTAAGGSGKGDYWITDFSLQQFIPSNPTAQNLTTTLTLTLS